ncbi:phosphatidylinositol alpha 1,6-mannosyltransferase [Barrientosiimonas humi]|uniref:D-inositol 3-phosphate glycosyltransferase n=1 Tax=Barrientosiimonas humi TaxID=999931 RepID=A0A542XDZ3_9MICO|nr:glycosyltransferase family 1 protein [Barrientosiimonas humi]TQL34049.1 phosphatidylinositol alpha 1,6-mannosyltransferase [Barrientosiimonas humi]CAG7574040.1 GDP-mannose-dependent alpha-mannosyltransferase [Barrientosiimonas humi]
MRIAIVTESFLPTLNGVTTSVCRVLDCLREAGHDALVIAPAPAPATYRDFPVRTVRGVTLRQFRVGLPSYELEGVLARFSPDVVHAASPFGLGARGLAAARNLGIPSVAVYQTDMPSYLKQHGGPLGAPVERAAWRWIRHFHTLADLTLAPSTQTLQELSAHGVPRTALWRRGVDAESYSPERRNDPEVADLRSMLAPRGETIVGYVGRLAPEKECHRLAEVANLPGVSLCLVGDGPTRSALEQLLPRANFLGYRSGLPLAHAYAALDVFVHTGTKETFGQTLQEAMAAGLPVVAPAAGGPLDIVKPGVTGLLFDPEQPGSLRQAVGGLVADPAMRARMGASGRGKVETRSWKTLTAELLEFYGSVINPAWAPGIRVA